MGDPDVVVVGAGPAGLTCARVLARSGCSVIVVEARDRIGGRLHDMRDAEGCTIELGAQVLHGEPLPDLPSRPVAHPETGVVLDGVCHDPDSLGAAGIVAPWAVQHQMLSRPRPAGMTVDTIVGVLPRTAARIAGAWFEQVWGAAPDELDVAGIAEAQRGRGTAQWSPVGGFAALLTGLADGLDVRLATAVRDVAVDGRAVRLGLNGPTGRAEMAARRMVLTVPPLCALPPRVGWHPLLSAERVSAATQLAPGAAVVVVVETDTAASRDARVLLTAPPRGLWSTNRGCRTVVGHVKGPGAAGFTVDGDTVWPILRLLLGDRARPTGVRIVDWTADPWSGGGYSLPRPGATAAALEWARPAPPLYFAGEATALPTLRGRIQGALSTGERAAAEVLADHRSSTGNRR